MKLAARLAPRKVKVRFVPNVSRLKLSKTKKVDIARPFTFLSVGRLSEQKNPREFAKLSLIIGKNLGDKFVWIGDGDDIYKDELISQKVEITGWLSEEEVVKRLQSGHVYIHVARWEGFPLAILDAFNAGLPIIVNPIPAYGELEPIQTIEFGAIEIHSDYENFLAKNRAAWQKTLRLNTISSQRNSLDVVWNEQ